MTSGQAKRYVLLAMVLSAGIATVRPLMRAELPSVSVPIGVFVAGLMLALLSEFAPSLAGAFAVLIVVTTLLTAGDVWTALPRAFAR